MSPVRTHFLKNASRRTRIRAETATPSGSASSPAPNSAQPPSGRSTWSRPRAICENAPRTAAREADGLVALESSCEAVKNPGSESMARQLRGVVAIDWCGR